MKSLIPQIVLVFVFNVVTTAQPQDSLDVYDLDEDIVITATKLPLVFSDVARSVEVLMASDIRRLPVQSVPELLEYAAGVDVQQRGTQGMQADVSIRGAGFEQTLILLDGVKMNDPQTGHHNMNIPLHVYDIERVEVLRGPGSRLYGPNAFGGVINIITRKADKAGVFFFSTLGEHNLNDAGVSLYYPWGAGKHRISAARGSSDGYRPNTDFLNTTISHNSTFEFDAFSFSASSGYSEKQFGANSFYSTRFPEQYEETEVWYLHGAATYKLPQLRVHADLSYREHMDVFRLVRSDPDFYENKHRTHVVNGSLQISYYSVLGISSVGLEQSDQAIRSNNLGHHERAALGGYFQHQFSAGPLNVAAGVSTYKYSREDWRSWPGLDVNLRLLKGLRFYGSISQGFRVPTYTELYYSDPATSGNSDLESETSLNYEGGLNWRFGLLQLDVALFNRENEDLIDYVYNPADSIYYARNLTAMTTNGIESSVQLFPEVAGIDQLTMRYSYLDSDLDKSGFTSRYTLSHFRSRVLFGLDHTLPFFEELSLNWKLRYEERLTSGERWLGDVRVNYAPTRKLNIFLDITNIGDVRYADIPGVPMPGRWVKAGLNFRIGELGE